MGRFGNPFAMHRSPKFTINPNAQYHRYASYSRIRKSFEYIGELNIHLLVVGGYGDANTTVAQPLNANPPGWSAK